MKTRILSFLLACLMVMSCIPAMTLFAFAEEEAYDYNKLYVGDGLRYHLSFIGVDVEEEGLPISYTDGTISFSYKPNGVSMASIDTLVEVRENLGKAEYYATERFAENPNKEMFKIEGLDAEKSYKITIGASTLAQTFTGEELAQGVDISCVAGNPSIAVMNKIVDQLYTKRTNIAKLRNMSYVRETELYKRGVDDSVATKDEIFAALDAIIAEKPVGNYARTTAEQYKEYYDIQDSFFSTINLCDYNVKKLLDFEPYTVTISEAN